MQRLDVLVSLAVIVAVLAPRCVVGTPYTFTVNSYEGEVHCTSEQRQPPSCTSSYPWYRVLDADELDGSNADVTLSTTMDCSMQLACHGWTVLENVSNWTAVAVTNVTVRVDWSFEHQVDVSIGLMDTSGVSSAFTDEQTVRIVAGSNYWKMPPSLYGITPFPITELTPGFGAYLRLQRTGTTVGSPPDFFVDGFLVTFQCTGDATISGITPHENVDPGDAITITGVFFDTKPVGHDPQCQFRVASTAAIIASSNVISISTTEVVCSVPAGLGTEPDVLDVTVTLDQSQGSINPGTVMYYRQAAPKPSTKPKPWNDDIVGFMVAAAAGVVVAVAGIAGLMMTLRRSSSRHDGNNPGPNRFLVMDSSAVAGSGGGGGGAVFVAGGAAGSVPAMGKRKVSQLIGAGADAGAPRRPSGNAKARRSNSSTGVAGNTYETIPVSEFRMTRRSMATEYSVTSEQAPYFPGRR